MGLRYQEEEGIGRLTTGVGLSTESLFVSHLQWAFPTISGVRITCPGVGWGGLRLGDWTWFGLEQAGESKGRAIVATVQLMGEQRVVLEQVNWQAHEALLNSWADLPVRTTCDRGRLEIMSPRLVHEQYSSLIARMIETFTLERRISCHSGGSTTFKSELKQRGLEPDRSYWIQNAPRMRTRKEFDLEHDPPPDLAIEVDITSSSLDRMGICADLGVPEVWRFDGSAFSINLLVGAPGYEQAERSRALPAFTRSASSHFSQRRSNSRLG